MTWRTARPAHHLALALALAGCGGGPQWTGLAPGAGAPGAPTSVELGALAGRDGASRRLVTRDGEVRLELELSPAWRRDERGPWRAPLGFQPIVHDGHELVAGETRFAPAPPEARGDVAKLPVGTFSVARAELWLRLADGGEPPARATLSCRLASSDAAGGGRLRGRRFSGAGFAVWPGAPVERECELERGSVLRFATALDPLVPGSTSALPAVVFKVALDGAPLFEHREADPTLASVAWHEVALPSGARGRARLSFSVEGTPAYASFLAPALGPAEVGAPGARPWDERRRDVVVFLADTFRADNMALYGGDVGLTPNLDRFALASVAFARAWSVGTFTLSAHATMFTGLYPHQAGVLGESHALPESLETLAERLAAAGYRTGAITDSGIVSQAYALDQGFEYFDEGKRPLEATLAAARAFLDADDGRPVFLFVHTYRVHRPFVVSPETREQHGARLGIDGTFRGLEKELVELSRRSGHPEVARVQEVPAEVVASDAGALLVRRLRAHYRGGVIDLDRGFEAFRADLEARGTLRHGFLVFTSDHGEAFGEQSQLYHKNDVYEAITRVPLVIGGGGLAPRVVTHAASLLDLSPTIAALAGVEPSRDWLGRRLLELDEERTLYAFECARDSSSSTFSAVERGRKVIGLEDRDALRAGRLVGAFDLVRDPHELEGARADETWPAEQLERLRPTVEQLLQPIVERQSAVLEPEKQSELEGLGYGGGDEDDENP